MLVGTKIISKITTKFRLIRKIHVVIVFFILFRDTFPGASCFFCLNIVAAVKSYGRAHLYITILLGKDWGDFSAPSVRVLVPYRKYGGVCTMHLEKDEKKLERHLREIYSKGVDLYLEGEPASPEEIARKFFVNEDTVYMPDFVTDEDGTLREVRYDRVEYR